MALVSGNGDTGESRGSFRDEYAVWLIGGPYVRSPLSTERQMRHARKGWVGMLSLVLLLGSNELNCIQVS